MCKSKDRHQILHDDFWSYLKSFGVKQIFLADLKNDILLAFHFVDQFLEIWFPCFICSILKSLRHSTFLRFWLKNYLLFFAVFPDTKNAPQILFFTNFFHIMPKLINFNHNYIKLNNCCYNFYKMFIMLNMAFKCDQKSSCERWWPFFDLHIG